ncbi:MAG: hypothetical protein FJY80_03225 [Candidatus Aminicenantes bacterium]|nr:hypothetical protein [Candidatus Aminicenantes bacterium]
MIQTIVPRAEENGHMAFRLGSFSDLDQRTVDAFVRRLYEDNGNLSLKQLMNGLERKIILSVLTRTKGHKRRTAKILGLKPTTLSEKAKRFCIQAEFK